MLNYATSFPFFHACTCLLWHSQVTGFLGRGLDCSDQKGRVDATPSILAEMRARLLQLWEVGTPDLGSHEASSEGPLLLLVELQLPSSVVVEDSGWERIAKENLIVSKEPIRLERIDGTRLSFVQRLSRISRANVLVVHTGAPALGGAAMMAHGSVVVELLRYIGQNSSVSIGASIAWTSMPDILRMPFEFFDEDGVPSSPNWLLPPARLRGVRIPTSRFTKALVIAVEQWGQRNDSPFGAFDGVAPKYNSSQLDLTCDFLRQSTDVSLTRWLCLHTSIEMWDDAFQEEHCGEKNGDLASGLFSAHSV